MALYPILAALQESHAAPAPAPGRPPARAAPAPFPARAPSPAPAPPPTPPRAPARPQQSARDNAARPGGAERQGAGNAAAGAPGAEPAAQHPQRDWSGGGQSGGGDRQDGLSAGGIGQDIDTEALLDLLPIGADSGIFEVLLAGGETLVVVTDVRNTSASILLKADSDKLRSQLLQKRLELESGLKRRMNRQVRLAVL